MTDFTFTILWYGAVLFVELLIVIVLAAVFRPDLLDRLQRKTRRNINPIHMTPVQRCSACLAELHPGLNGKDHEPDCPHHPDYHDGYGNGY